MKARDILWDITDEDIYEVIDEMTVYRAAEALDIPTITYANMTTEERHDYIGNWSSHNSFKSCNISNN